MQFENENLICVNDLKFGMQLQHHELYVIWEHYDAWGCLSTSYLLDLNFIGDIGLLRMHSLLCKKNYINNQMKNRFVHTSTDYKDFSDPDSLTYM